MGRQADKGIKDRSLIHFFQKELIFKIGLNHQKSDRPKSVQTNGQKVLNIGIWCHTFQTKKRSKNWTVRTEFERDRQKKDGRPSVVRMKKQKVQKIGI